MSTTINVLHSDGSLETFTTTSETTAGIRSAACRRLREADGTSVSFVRCGVRFTKTADRRGWRHEMAEPPAPLTAEEVAGRLLSCSGADVEALTDEERGWAEDVCMGAVRDLCVSDDGEVSWRGFADALADVRTAFSGLLRLDPFGTAPLPHLEPEWPDGHGSEDGPAEAGGFLSAVARPALTVGRAVATALLAAFLPAAASACDTWDVAPATHQEVLGEFWTDSIDVEFPDGRAIHAVGDEIYQSHAACVAALDAKLTAMEAEVEAARREYRLHGGHVIVQKVLGECEHHVVLDKETAR